MPKARRPALGQEFRMAANVMDNVLQEGSRDIVILVMGPTGAGKSTFINAVLGGQTARMPVGHKLTSCTTLLDCAVVEPLDIRLPSGLENCRVIMVDTPGFDDTYESDISILRRIADWLEQSHRQRTVLGGVIYLHDISYDRFSATASKNLEMFKHLCGEAALSKVILGTTKWTRFTGPRGAAREKELETEHWKSLTQKGSRVRRFEDTHESALGFINDILLRVAFSCALAIQKELVDEKKILPETRAGRLAVIYAAQRMVDVEKELPRLRAELAVTKDAKKKEELEAMKRTILQLRGDVNQMKVPIRRRILRFMGIELT
ncbi:putative 50S ribosome-binding GTPase [Lyophyllum shimeji]|uniref:50S ribosome-binding GTPase n=1 Tax=Lyophyllum shimeji TaxID=47721 RepID=A0A9P3PQU6_LYOSH|nr:putative 50S ribosome-binding GTPase [Lyophyllum shimeji]